MLPLIVGIAAATVGVHRVVTPPSGVAGVPRRALLSRTAAAIGGAVFTGARAANADGCEDKARKEITGTASALKQLYDDREEFKLGLTAADASKPQLPPAVPFRTFQALEGKPGVEPDFMEIAIDYIEAHRNARDLVKLAKLTKQKVEVKGKDASGKDTTVVAEYGEAGGLASTAEYADRAIQEVLGASVALGAAVKAMSSQ